MVEWDETVLRLAAQLDCSRRAALGLRQLLWAFVADLKREEDLSDVPEAEWALALGVEKGDVHRVLDAFIAADFLHRRDGRLLISDWESVRDDERSQAFRAWLRAGETAPDSWPGMNEEMEEAEAEGRLRYLLEQREPGEGWRQQARFLAVIGRVGDEKDRLVRLLRALRMLVGPDAPLSEDAWEKILVAADAVLDMEDPGIR